VAGKLSAPVAVVGSGPGGLQTSYSLMRLGVPHIGISADEAPGGMFRRFPLFERLITWTKPHAPAEPGTREYQWYDWNSLLGDEPAHEDTVRPLMDGTSYFPSRAEMEGGLVSFTRRAGLPFRYGCTWTGTKRDDEGFVLETSDGELRCSTVVFAMGMTQPWTPPGLEAPHYVDTRPAREYAGRRVFVAGKRNSAFEIADALLPWAKQIILGSPRPAKISVLARSTAAARARYLQPYEDHVLGGGTLVLDCAIERVEATADGYRVTASGTTTPGPIILQVDDVIAATGFAAPLGDLPQLGVGTFYQGRLPVQTPFFQSASVPGVFFAGSITQGSVGLKKHGIPSNSAAVHGFRYNARLLARHIAETRFGVAPYRRPVGDVAGFLLDEASHAPELWNQQAYLARVVSEGMDQGIVPLAHFVDSAGPDAIAMTIETDPAADIHPVAYVRRQGNVIEVPLPPQRLHDYQSEDYRKLLESAI
jgi:thioredoxin reductase